MSHANKSHQLPFVEPEFSVVAMIAVDRARRQGIAPASVPVRELEAEAEALLEEAGGFWGLVGEVSP